MNAGAPSCNLSRSRAVRPWKNSSSTSTFRLRADLGRLAREGALIRSYGGAMVHDDHSGDYPLTIKTARNQSEKLRIGTAAARLIKPRQTVILDSGSTSGAVARAIRHANLDTLTVMTHALNIAMNCRRQARSPIRIK